MVASDLYGNRKQLRLRATSSTNGVVPKCKVVPLYCLIFCALFLIIEEIFYLLPEKRVSNLNWKPSIGFVGDDSNFQNGMFNFFGAFTSTAEQEEVQPNDAADLGSPDEDVEDGNRRKLVWLSNEEHCSHIVWGRTWKAGCKMYSNPQNRLRPSARKTRLDLRLVDICAAHHEPFHSTISVNNTVRYQESDTASLLAVSPAEWMSLLVSPPSQNRGNRKFWDRVRYQVVGRATVVLPIANQNHESLVSQYVRLSLRLNDLNPRRFGKGNRNSAPTDLPLTQHPDITPEVLRQVSLSLADHLVQLTSAHRLAVRETEGGSSEEDENELQSPGFSGFSLEFTIIENQDGSKGVAITTVSSLAEDPAICGTTDIPLRDDILTLLWTKHIQLKEPEVRLNSLVRITNNVASLPSQLTFVSGYNLADLAVEVTKGLSKKVFHIHQYPHFAGGKATMDNYMRLLGFQSASKYLENHGRNQAITDPLKLTAASNFLIASCRGPQPLFNALKRTAVASFVPRENYKTDKDSVFRNLKDFYTKRKCDINQYMPETVMTDTKDSCPSAIKFFEREVQLESSGKQVPSKWFGKTRTDTVSRGVSLLNSKSILKGLKKGCPTRPAFRPFLLQREIPNKLLYNGRVTQAQHFLIITSRSPWTVMYMDGYYHVAQLELEPKEPLVEDGSSSNTQDDSAPTHRRLGKQKKTNPKILDRQRLVPNILVNRQGNRITQHDMEQYLMEQRNYTREDVLEMRRRTKKLAMSIGMTLKAVFNKDSSLDASKPSSFMILGLDVVYDDSLVPRLLETNCNCELFNNVRKFGIERVELTRRLLGDTLQLAIVTNLGDKQQFTSLVQDWVASGEHTSAAGERLATPLFEDTTTSSNLEVRDESTGPQLGFRPSMTLQLVYTDAIRPPWKYSESGTC